MTVRAVPVVVPAAQGARTVDDENCAKV